MVKLRKRQAVCHWRGRCINRCDTVSTYFRLLHDNLSILCTFYFTNPIAQSWWRTK